MGHVPSKQDCNSSALFRSSKAFLEVNGRQRTTPRPSLWNDFRNEVGLSVSSVSWPAKKSRAGKSPEVLSTLERALSKFVW